MKSAAETYFAALADIHATGGGVQEKPSRQEMTGEVDPLTGKISVLSLEEGLYEVQEFTGTQPIASRIFPELEWTAAQILQAD
jgi:hypothetical protein